MESAENEDEDWIPEPLTREEMEEDLEWKLRLHSGEPIRRLKDVRVWRGLSQAHLGRLMGVSQQMIQRLEKAPESATTETIVRYALAVGAMVSHKIERLPDFEINWAKLDRNL
jgi:DNA-binding XRE family transcriptional regulator